MIYARFVLELSYQHHTVILEIKNKIWTSFKARVSKMSKKNTAEKNLGVTINFYKKLCLPACTSSIHTARNYFGSSCF